MTFEQLREFRDEMFLSVWPMLAVLSLIAFCYYLYSGVSCTIDFFWVFNHFAVATYFLVTRYDQFDLKMLLGYTLILLWFGRQGYFLFLRVANKLEDERYVLMGSRFSDKVRPIYFFFNYQLQGFLLLQTGSCLFWLIRKRNDENGVVISTQNNILFAVGFLCALKGLVMEAVADNELEEWKKEKKGVEYVSHPAGDSQKELQREDLRKKFYRNCIDGEWEKTRHPNLLHEAEFWFGVALCSIDLGTIESFAAFFGPFILYRVMVRLTIPITDKVMKAKRPYWNEYKETIPGFFPKNYFNYF